MAIRDNNRDVELSISTKVGGIENVRQLQQSLLDLAKEGGDAAPEFKRLADEIGRIGEQNAALDTFTRLTGEVAALTEAQTGAAAKVGELSGALKTLSAETERFAAAETKSKDALKVAQRDLVEKRDALARLKIEYSDAGAKSEDYRRQVTKLSTEILDAKAGVRALSDEYRAAAGATKDVAAEESKLAAQQKAANRDLRESTTALESRQAALDQSAGAMKSVGVATEDLAASQRALLASFSGVRDEAERTVLQVENLARVEKELADQHAFDKQAADAAKLLAAAEYVKFWTDALDQADRAEKALSQQKVFDKQHADAAKLVTDAEYVRFWADSLNKAEAAERDAAQAATVAANAINQALGSVGVRAAKDIEAEIVKVRTSLDLLKSSGTLTGVELDRAFAQGSGKIKGLERDLRAATGQLTLMDRAAGAFKNTAVQLATGFGLITVLQQLASGFIENTKRVEGLRLGLTTIFGSAKIAAEQIDFLRKTANAAGVSFGSISDAYVKFAASSHSANIPLEQTNALFEALTRASGTLGLSGERVGLMLEALGQMASKGVVQMEELRGQLGDSLPGALSLTAKGLGITTQELFKLVQSGGLLYRDLVPALTKSLKSLGGEVDTLNSHWERFKNLLSQTATTASDSGWTKVLNGSLAVLGGLIASITSGASVAFDVIFTGFQKIAVLAAAVVNRDFKGIHEEFARINDEFVDRQAKQGRALRAALEGTKEPLNEAAAGTRELTAATQQASAAADTHAAAQMNVAAAVSQTAVASGAAERIAKDGTRAMLEAAIAAEVAGVKVGNVADGWVKLGAAYAKTSIEQARQVELADKVVKATQIQGSAVEELTKLSGSERDALIASEGAAIKNADALGKLATARQTELEAMRTQLATLVQLSAQLGDPDGSRQKAIDDLQKTIELRRAESESAVAAAESAKTDAAQRTLSVKAYQDNAAAVDALRAAMNASLAALRDLTTLEGVGLATREQVTEATRRAAAAEGLYRDALADSEAAAARSIETLKIRAVLSEAHLRVDLERAKTNEAEAVALGRNYDATQAKIAQKEIEIRITESTVAALQGEAKAEIAAAESKRAALTASGELTAQRAAEIDSAIGAAKAKLLEADATRESIGQIRAEIEGLERNTNARHRNADAIDRQASSLERLTDDGFKANKDGAASGTFSNLVPVNTAFALIDKEKAGTLSSADLASAREGMQQARNAQAYIEAQQRIGGSVSLAAIRSTNDLVIAATRILESVQSMAGGNGGVATPPAVSQQPSVPAAPATVAPKEVHYFANVALDGRNTKIQVASQGDAEAVMAIVRQLAAAKGTAA